METSTSLSQIENITDVVGEQPVIQIGLVESIIAIVVLVFGIGVAWGSLKTKLTHISEALHNRVEPDLKNIRERFGSLEKKVDILWEKFTSVETKIITLETKVTALSERSNYVKNKIDTLWKDRLAPQHSPRQLNAAGEDVLFNSGIKEIIDEKKNELRDIIKKKDISNVYDAEQTIFSVMQELPAHCPDIVDRLKEGAFRTGADIEAVLFAGSIYLRNEIFVDLGFSLDDLDKPKEKG